MLIKISKQQLDSRWDSMPEILRGTMSSEINSDIVWKTAESEHLPKDKITTVSRIVGYILMGFLHPEDLAREIQENLGVDIRIAESIADPINKKIFQPLREELEKIYSPALSGAEVPVAGEGEQAGSPQPVLMDSINSPQVDSVSPPQAEKAIKPASSSQVPKFFQTGQIPRPAAPPPAPVPKPAAQSMPAVSLSNPPAAPTATIPSVAPFMLHMESKSQPLSPSKSDFKIGLSQEQFGKMEQKWTAPPRPAQVETGFVTQPKTEIQKPPASPSVAAFAKRDENKPDPRVVHYNAFDKLSVNEMKTPIALALSKVEVPTPSARGARLPDGQGSAFGGKDASILPPVPKPPAASKTGIPVPPSPPKPAIAQATPQKPAEPPKPMVRQSSPQEEMLSGKPEEKELPEPHAEKSLISKP